MKLTKKEMKVIILLAQKLIIELETKKSIKQKNIELQNKDYNKDYNLVIDDVGQVYNPTLSGNLKCEPCDD